MNYSTQRVRKSIEQDTAFVQRVLGMSVVPNDEIAKKVGDGITALKKMSAEEAEKLSKLSVEEIVEGWENSDIKIMAKAVEHSLGLMNDALAGRQLRNPMMQLGNVRKGLEHLQDHNSGVRLLSNQMAGPESTGIDLGWRRAFNFLSLSNEKEVEIMNWRTGLRFLEYAYRTDAPAAESIGGRTNQRQGPRFFAAAFRHHVGDMPHSVVTINEMLSYMRAEALTMQSLLGYRTIFSKSVGGTDVVDFAFDYSDVTTFEDWSTSSDDPKTIREYEVYQVRHVLNEARRRMIDAASQSQNLVGRTSNREAPIKMTAADTMLVYYNHAHEELIEKVMSDAIRGEDGINPVLLSNIAFIKTAAAPVGGGYDVTARDTGHDSWGFREDLSESVAGKRGIMMVIPANMNYFLNFRPLTFLSDAEPMRETEIVGAKFEANAIMDTRQKAHVIIADS